MQSEDLIITVVEEAAHTCMSAGKMPPMLDKHDGVVLYVVIQQESLLYYCDSEPFDTTFSNQLGAHCIVHQGDFFLLVSQYN